MPSPFPGMNPYLEQAGLWRGVHTRLLTDLQALLTPQVVPRYFVELEESLYIDPTQDEPRLLGVADVAVSAPGDAAGPGATATVPAPATVTVPGIARKKVRRLVVRDNSSLEVVTVLELLSPSNKQPGADRDRYVEKRHEVLTSRTSFIELDLLRGGKRLPVRPLPTCDYYALVSRWWERPEMGLWPVHLREPLPRIPVPLRRGEPEPLIDLKAAVDRAYDAAGYEYRIYRTAPEPPLAPADAEWARAFVPAAAAG
ncbi:Uncharacterized protein OS=Nostoc sp. (strain ATCC 29411 / PCC 7524) GN=Nos7524_2198 PE=4 SV=1: DUF4058 [Gemmataceae bacterium]|nr:Uncharacterized protein OS=Nostoc sp. (strain ATCC 29411 / PCC 7524) GN=Nos7524_2198 PE=4 SV=1: DUF4058 [Gemmataceae bacterium]VTT99189.1 Uncharacterized protein OS=Nostoc sp. (strain ATCC 29411 / PCC 7524) GN=Nos7524_2198 PE=4 SV=1: DUF4058 [Gemmataceae bacterium]